MLKATANYDESIPSRFAEPYGQMGPPVAACHDGEIPRSLIKRQPRTHENASPESKACPIVPDLLP